MSQEQNKDRLIKQGLQVHADNAFTDKIMQQLKEMEKVQDRKLSQVLLQHTLEEPSVHFTKQILNKIVNEQKQIEQPVVSKKMWLFLAAMVAVVVAVAIFDDQQSVSVPSWVEALSYNIAKFKISLPNAFHSQLLALSLLAFSSLFALENFLRNKLENYR